jgi:tight adherence protein C
MTRAVVLAFAAGAIGACAAVELALLRVAAARRGRDGRAADGRVRRLAGGLEDIGRRAGVPFSAPADLAARIAAAGLPARVGPADVMAVKVGAALTGVFAALPLAALLPGRLGPVAVLAAPIAGYLGPDLWLARRARWRGRAMEAHVADVLDLLRVAVAAGLPVGRAIGEVGRRRTGALGAELAAAATRIELGAPRARALEILVARCPIPAAGALALAIRRADRHGSPLAPALTALAADARAERARRLQERAARSAPKIQLVVALLLVPAVMLLIAAALVASLG